LKQASRSWYQKIDGELANLGFTRSQADHSVYVSQKGAVKVIIALYVDDLILLGND
jgi:virulence-associated protein VapD